MLVGGEATLIAEAGFERAAVEASCDEGVGRKGGGEASAVEASDALLFFRECRWKIQDMLARCRARKSSFLPHVSLRLLLLGEAGRKSKAMKL